MCVNRSDCRLALYSCDALPTPLILLRPATNLSGSCHLLSPSSFRDFLKCPLYSAVSIHVTKAISYIADVGSFFFMSTSWPRTATLGRWGWYSGKSWFILRQCLPRLISRVLWYSPIFLIWQSLKNSCFKKRKCLYMNNIPLHDYTRVCFNGEKKGFAVWVM